ncbi:pyrimidine reductase [Alkalilimnicola sp. S0819]|nr:pyrimidine reductase [Alkalilimnicola sp. S0819]MPQ15729.1 pyrimidine reductase [Alkalilimnicola sp. S0819]
MQRLYPLPAASEALQGCYLGKALRPAGWQGLFCYANYVTSLDGRIAAPASDGGLRVPETVANRRDWRLFQELAAHADVLITSGRYLRDLEEGSAQDVLPIGGEREYADLRLWRAQQGRPPQPDVAIMSASLDFPVPRELLDQGRRVQVFTGARHDEARARRLREQGAEVHAIGRGAAVSGSELMRALADLAYHNAYCVTGPYVLHSLMADGVVNSLFLTTVSRIIGGAPFSSIVEGPLLDKPVDYRLDWLYLDTQAPDGLVQLFARYNQQ